MNNKDGLPSWFLDDEAKSYKPNIPITKEAINVLREKQRALDARPIKKIAEAKARKNSRQFNVLPKPKRRLMVSWRRTILMIMRKLGRLGN